MEHILDRVVERAAGFDDETRNALVHLAAQLLAAKRDLTLIRSHTDKSGVIFDLFRDRRTGKVYVTRRPALTAPRQEALRAKLESILAQTGD